MEKLMMIKTFSKNPRKPPRCIQIHVDLQNNDQNKLTSSSFKIAERSQAFGRIIDINFVSKKYYDSARDITIY